MDREGYEVSVYVYVAATMKDGLPEAPVKVGISSNPVSRLQSLQTASPYQLMPFGFFWCPNLAMARVVETATHEMLEEDHMSGEWFSCDPLYAAGAICEVFRCVAEEADNSEDAQRILRNSGVTLALEKMTAYAKHLKSIGKL